MIWGEEVEEVWGEGGWGEKKEWEEEKAGGREWVREGEEREGERVEANRFSSSVMYSNLNYFGI